ncbi:MAG: hypothetical protein OEV44_11410, partial [Spirochaetota bacterium]|nr:hypothetical protein [Spirochaetota bacterium]
RRYHDLIIQRQIKNFLINKTPYYKKDEIQIVASTAERATKELKSIEKDTSRYWLLKYLKQEKKRTFKALVIKKVAIGYLVEIQEVFIQSILNTPANLKLDQEIDVSIERVNPLLDTLSIRRVV